MKVVLFLSLICPATAHEASRRSKDVPSGSSFRVAKALGSRGYNTIRVSHINLEGSSPSSSNESFRLLEGTVSNAVAFSYSSQFKHKWTDMHLSSALVEVTPGSKQTLNVAGHDLTVKIPHKGAGTTGLLIGDPCIDQTEWCPYADEFSVESTLQDVINSMTEHGELDYWMNLGDLFYDQSGNITSRFFSKLSLDAQASVHGICIGNHDYWQNGSPASADDSDNFGNGLMQWYAQDAMSAKANPKQLFDFSADPAKHEVAHHSNFFWYYMLGNVAFVSFSGAGSWSDNQAYFEEACAWAGEEKPALLVLMGHWDAQNLGCESGMDTPEAFKSISSLPGCEELASSKRIKYLEGHNHCNKITNNNTGFMLGSFGMGGCGDFGLPIMDTHGSEAILWYFKLGSGGKRHDDFDTVVDCIKTNGFRKCTQYADRWMEQSIPESPAMLV